MSWVAKISLRVWILVSAPADIRLCKTSEKSAIFNLQFHPKLGHRRSFQFAGRISRFRSCGSRGKFSGKSEHNGEKKVKLSGTKISTRRGREEEKIDPICSSCELSKIWRKWSKSERSRRRPPKERSIWQIRGQIKCPDLLQKGWLARFGENSKSVSRVQG